MFNPHAYKESRWIKYSPEQMFDLVADVNRYSQFLPWCLSTRTVRVLSETEFHSEMEVGFNRLREKYKSLVTLTPNSKIVVKSLDGLFKELHTQWTFDPAPQGGTQVGFEIRFAFRSKLLQVMIGTVFNEAARVMVRSFERRADVIYSQEPSKSL